MIRLVYTRLQRIRPLASTRTHGFSSSIVEPTLSTTNSTDPQSIALSYLVNSCGLSLSLAHSTSRKLQFETTDQPDSILKLLRDHGLNETNIKNLIVRRPLILQADVHKTLEPNLELLRTLGISGQVLVEIIDRNPRILETQDAQVVVDFFRSHCFSEKQILTLTMKRPNLFLYDIDKIIRPKLEYFEALGLSGVEIAKMLSSEPYILERSLENHIKSSVQVLRHIVGTDDNVLKVIKASYCILEFDLEEVLVGNVKILKNHGVPMAYILKLILLHPKSLLLRSYQFIEVVDKVKKLGFDPKSENVLFILAIRAVASMSKLRWEQKWKFYCSFGLTEKEIVTAFRLQPMCMLTSEKKINKLMNFFLNDLKLKPSIISKQPSLLLLSLEKRIVPRSSVLQLLLSNDLIRRNINPVYVFRMTEKLFVERFVTRYQHVIPEIVDAHQGKIRFQGFPIDLGI